MKDAITFESALALLLIGLKLASVIDWPWLWVLFPIWAPLAVMLLVLLAVLTFELARLKKG
jgi:hypothetical protein